MRYIIIIVCFFGVTISSQSQTSVLPEKQMTFFLSDSSVVSGTVLSADSVVVSVKTLDTIQIVPVRMINRVEHLYSRSSTPCTDNGLFLGGIGLPMFVYERKVGSTSGIYSVVGIIMALGTVGGGMAGYIIDLATQPWIRNTRLNSSNVDLLVIVDSSGATKHDMRQLLEFIRSTRSDRKLRIAFSSVTREFRFIHSKVKNRLDAGGYFDNEEAERTYDDINLLHRVDVSYSIAPKVDVGLSCIATGELQDYGVYRRDPTNTMISFYTPAYGVLATGMYRIPLNRQGTFDVAIGGGVGVSFVKHQLDITESFKQSPYYQLSTEITKGIVPTCSVITRVCYYTALNLTYGLTADATITGPLNIPANTKLGLPELKLPLMTASLGIYFGWSF